MAYSDQALLAADADFVQRLAAAGTNEGRATDVDVGAVGWATRHVWYVAAAPGFADAYASALAAGVPRPGNDQSVISDAELLSAVQALPVT